jgi:hypothetical protein
MQTRSRYVHEVDAAGRVIRVNLKRRFLKNCCRAWLFEPIGFIAMPPAYEKPYVRTEVSDAASSAAAGGRSR